MSENQRGHVVDEISPLIAISVGQSGAIAVRDVEGERIPEDRISRVTTGHVFGCPVVQLFRFWVCCGVSGEFLF